MSANWITDRRPKEKDVLDGLVIRWNQVLNQIEIVYWRSILEGVPWMPIFKPEPYVKPKRWGVREFGKSGQWYIVEVTSPEHAWGFTIPTREAAERIAAIYEEVMP